MRIVEEKADEEESRQTKQVPSKKNTTNEQEKVSDREGGVRETSIHAVVI